MNKDYAVMSKVKRGDLCVIYTNKFIENSHFSYTCLPSKNMQSISSQSDICSCPSLGSLVCVLSSCMLYIRISC